MVKRRARRTASGGMPVGMHAHMKKKGGCMLVIGLAIALNAYYMWTDAWMLFGGLIALGGLAKMLMKPCC